MWGLFIKRQTWPFYANLGLIAARALATFFLLEPINPNILYATTIIVAGISIYMIYRIRRNPQLFTSVNNKT